MKVNIPETGLIPFSETCDLCTFLFDGELYMRASKLPDGPNSINLSRNAINLSRGLYANLNGSTMVHRVDCEINVLP
jgi:hypothetical protein